MLGLEPADLELDDDVAQLLEVEEEQVDMEVVAVDLEVDLAPDIGESSPELQQGLLEPVHQGLFDISFPGVLGDGEEVQDVRVLVSCWASSESGWARWWAKFDGAAPVRWCRRPMIWLSSTLRDHPCCSAAPAYQSRS